MIKLQTFITIVIFSIIGTNCYAQGENSRVATYIQQYKQLAIDEMIRTGVPASITLAQGILETGGGQSDLASQANNHFGIKCKQEWTGETILHDDDKKNECFRKYPSVEESFKDHSEFLRSRPNYAFLFKLDPTDYEGWAKGLKKAGYATNPAYPQSLMKLIVENNLQEYSLIALNRQQTVETELFVINEETKASATPIFPDTKETVKPAAQTSSFTSNQSRKIVDHNLPVYPEGEVFTINETRVIFSNAGTSLLAMANNFNISYKKILEFNELPEVDILNTSQLIFLQKKPKKGSKDVHIVEANEKLHDICQKEGIQLSSLMEYNRLQKGMEPAKGKSLYLKYPSPVSPKLASNNKSFTETSMR